MLKRITSAKTKKLKIYTDESILFLMKMKDNTTRITNRTTNKNPLIMKRREIIKQLGVFPIAGSFLATGSMFGGTFNESSPINRGTALGDESVFGALGVETII